MKKTTFGVIFSLFFFLAVSLSFPAKAASGETVTGLDTPFYSIFCQASTDWMEAQAYAEDLAQYGFPTFVFLTTDWENLNPEPWYVVGVGRYNTEEAALRELPYVQYYYPEAYVKYSGAFRRKNQNFPQGSSPSSSRAPSQGSSSPGSNGSNGSSVRSGTLSPFYGIFCQAEKDGATAWEYAREFTSQGFSATVIVTSDWSNLNPETWYVVTAGTYASESAAQADLPRVLRLYPDAYVKYTGSYRGSLYSSGAASSQGPSGGLAAGRSPFYGIFCQADKDEASARENARVLSSQGFSATVIVTSDWSNLNPERWYVVTCGTYSTEASALSALPGVQRVYPDAYVKFSGSYLR